MGRLLIGLGVALVLVGIVVLFLERTGLNAGGHGLPRTQRSGLVSSRHEHCAQHSAVGNPLYDLQNAPLNSRQIPNLHQNASL
jgi:hypothetical protein